MFAVWRYSGFFKVKIVLVYVLIIFYTEDKSVQVEKLNNYESSPVTFYINIKKIINRRLWISFT